MNAPLGFTLAFFLVIGSLAVFLGVLRLAQASRDQRLPRLLNPPAPVGPAAPLGPTRVPPTATPQPSLRMA